MAGGSILIVEDDAGIRLMLELALAERGYVAESAATVADALAAARRLRPGLVLLDALLGSEHGSQFAVFGRDPDMKIIVMTASENAADAAAAMGADGHLAKPFDLDEIYDLAERYVGAVR